MLQRVKRSKTMARRAGLPALALAAVAGVMVARNMRPATGNKKVPQPCKPVDLTRYLGKWYELARYDNWFERGCDAVTAEYGLLPDGKVSVRNACRRGGLRGPEKVTTGKAQIIPNAGNTKLKVSFFGPFYIGSYWVLDHGDDYEWSIVGEPSGRFLWILVRDPHLENAMQASLYRRARALGYDTVRLRPTRQL
jgi:apolipoprotein D and lipocalin family protein